MIFTEKKINRGSAVEKYSVQIFLLFTFSSTVHISINNYKSILIKRRTDASWNGSRLSQPVAPARVGVREEGCISNIPAPCAFQPRLFSHFVETTRRIVTRRVLRQLKTTKRRKCGRSCVYVVHYHSEPDRYGVFYFPTGAIIEVPLHGAHILPRSPTTFPFTQMGVTVKTFLCAKHFLTKHEETHSARINSLAKNVELIFSSSFFLPFWHI